MEDDGMFRPHGYLTSQGYIGFLPDGSRMLFSTEEEYMEYLAETNEQAA